MIEIPVVKKMPGLTDYEMELATDGREYEAAKQYQERNVATTQDALMVVELALEKEESKRCGKKRFFPIVTLLAVIIICMVGHFLGPLLGNNATVILLLAFIAIDQSKRLL